MKRQPVRDAVEGLKETLAARGYDEGDRIRFVVKNAQGQTNNASLVARQLVEEEPDLIYALGTPLIVALAQQTRRRRDRLRRRDVRRRDRLRRGPGRKLQPP